MPVCDNAVMPSLTRGRCALALVVSVGFVLGVTAAGRRRVAAQTARRSSDAAPAGDPRADRGPLRRGRGARRQRLDPHDPIAAALEGARADRARPLRRSRSRAAARSRRVRRRARRRSSSACSADARTRRRQGAFCNKVAAQRDRIRSSRGAGAPRARRVPGGERRLPRRGGQRAQATPRQHRVGRAVPREVQQRRSAEIVSDRAAGRSASGRRRCSAPRGPSPTTTRRRRSRSRSRRSRSTRPSVDALRVSRAARRPTPDHHDDAREALQKALAVNPVEPRRALALGGARLRRGQAGASSTPKSPRRWRSRRTTARSTASPASWRRTTTASTRRWR